MSNRTIVSTSLAVCLFVASQPEVQAQPLPRVPVRKTVLGTCFAVDPRFEQAIDRNVAKVRRILQQQRQRGRLIAYLSVPISPRGGGYEPTNLAISASVKKRLEREYGEMLYVLDPGTMQLPKVDGFEPGGGEYLYMWTRILAGENGRGELFDMVYFLGPSDVRRFFGRDGLPVIDAVQDYVDRQAKADESFRRAIASNERRRREFVRFYALRASTAYSKGAHDEWNIFVRINRGRGIGSQVAVYFDGRAVSPAEMETMVTRGYELPPAPNQRRGR